MGNLQVNNNSVRVSHPSAGAPAASAPHPAVAPPTPARVDTPATSTTQPALAEPASVNTRPAQRREETHEFEHNGQIYTLRIRMPAGSDKQPDIAELIEQIQKAISLIENDLKQSQPANSKLNAVSFSFRPEGGISNVSYGLAGDSKMRPFSPTHANSDDLQKILAAIEKALGNGQLLDIEVQQKAATPS